MLYFAYGSNLNWDQIRKRCESAKFVGVAKLVDHKLAFTRMSSQRKCGVLDIVPATGDVVWGVVYDIDEADVGALDSSEGYRTNRIGEKNAYNREEITVLLDGDPIKPKTVSTYIVVCKRGPYMPSRDYMALILEGAMYWQLPGDYVRQLRAILTT